jgi:APA family basic amino acid/polyamine antiporter
MPNDRGIVAEGGLVRALGVRGLTATAFNVMIGTGIFVLPSIVAADLGARAPLAYVVCALAMGSIVLCFAEAGSRVSLTGGPYAYVEVALGPFVGFLGGVLLWLVGVFATAAVASALVGSAAVFWPRIAAPVPRGVLLVGLFSALAVVNVLGVRQGARVIEAVTVAKLLPLVGLVVVGAFAGRAMGSGGAGSFTGSEPLGRSAVVLLFAFAGVESALVPSGEIRDPARTVPRALAIVMVAVTGLYIAVQLVAQRILGVDGLAAAREAPLAAAATRVAGTVGGGVVAAGAVISMLGHVSGMVLAMPRALYAFGRDGRLPVVSRALGAIHPRYRTPYVAIVVHAAIVCALAMSSAFAPLAILANVSVLVLYFLCCVAVVVLRRRDVRDGGQPFRSPGGPVVPLVALAMIVWLLAHASVRELTTVGAVLVVAALLFGSTWRRLRAPIAPAAGTRAEGRGRSTPI